MVPPYQMMTWKHVPHPVHGTMMVVSERTEKVKSPIQMPSAEILGGAQKVGAGVKAKADGSGPIGVMMPFPLLMKSPMRPFSQTS
jgi:hypothetical protein